MTYFHHDAYQPGWLMRIPKAHRNSCAGVWNRCGAYSADEGMDGFLPEEIVRALASDAEIEQLVQSGQWVWVADQEGWQMTDWAPANRLKADIDAYREADAERKRKTRASGRTSARTSSRTREDINPEVGERPIVRTDVRSESGEQDSKGKEFFKDQRAEPHARQLNGDPLPPRTVGVPMPDFVRAQMTEVRERVNRQHAEEAERADRLRRIAP